MAVRTFKAHSSIFQPQDGKRHPRSIKKIAHGCLDSHAWQSLHCNYGRLGVLNIQVGLPHITQSTLTQACQVYT